MFEITVVLDVNVFKLSTIARTYVHVLAVSLRQTTEAECSKAHPAQIMVLEQLCSSENNFALFVSLKVKGNRQIFTIIHMFYEVLSNFVQMIALNE